MFDIHFQCSGRFRTKSSEKCLSKSLLLMAHALERPQDGSQHIGLKNDDVFASTQLKHRFNAIQSISWRPNCSDLCGIPASPRCVQVKHLFLDSSVMFSQKWPQQVVKEQVIEPERGTEAQSYLNFRMHQKYKPFLFFVFFSYVTPNQMQTLKFLYLFLKFFLRRGARNDSQLQHRGPLVAVRLLKAKKEEDCIRAIMNDASSGSQEHPVWLMVCARPATLKNNTTTNIRECLENNTVNKLLSEKKRSRWSKSNYYELAHGFNATMPASRVRSWAHDRRMFGASHAVKHWEFLVKPITGINTNFSSNACPEDRWEFAVRPMVWNRFVARGRRRGKCW